MGVFLRPLNLMIISSGEGAGDIIELGICMFMLGGVSRVIVTPANCLESSARAPLVLLAAGVPVLLPVSILLCQKY